MIKKPFYRGYIVVIAATAILIVGYGTFYSYTVFFDSLSRDFNLTRGATSLIYSLAMLISGLVSILAGRVNDRLGPKVVILFCGSVLGAGYLLMYLATASWHVFVIYCVFGAIGAGGLYPAAVPTVARWFTGRRGLMTGIVTAGVGTGSAVFPPIISHLISIYEWRMTYVILGIIVLVVVLVASQFVKKEPDRASAGAHVQQSNPELGLAPGTDLTYGQVIRTRQFWMIAVTYICIGYVQVSIMVHIVPYATGLGISALSAATILSVMSISSVTGRLIVGTIADRLRVKPLLIGLMVFIFLSSIGIEFTHSFWGFFLVGIPFGMGYGSSATVQPLAIVEMFGFRSMGVVLGSMLLSVCIGAALGPVITGILYDATHNYQLALLISIFVALAGLLLALWLTPSKKSESVAPQMKF